jgi:hypothetical protein
MFCPPPANQCLSDTLQDNARTLSGVLADVVVASVDPSRTSEVMAALVVADPW